MTNSVIGKIAGRALDDIVPETWTTLSGDKVSAVQHRTAELVAQECSRLILEWGVEPFPLDPEFAANLIKQHFGLK